jgi:hypothetical protein
MRQDRLGLLGAIVVCFLNTAFAQSGDQSDVGKRASDAMKLEGLRRSEHILDLHVHQHKFDDAARLQLGLTQFLVAVENLGRGLYRYGLISGGSEGMFLRLPIPKNENPSEIDCAEFLLLIDRFQSDLMKAEGTLAMVQTDDVKVPLKLADVVFRLGPSHVAGTSLVSVIESLRQGGLNITKDNPEYLMKFDRGDVAWLRSYCHLLSGMVDVYHAYDVTMWFNDLGDRVFPRIKKLGEQNKRRDMMEITLADPTRLHGFRKHLLAVCDLNAETWRHIRAERDDDFEWLPHAKQTDQLGIPLSDAQIDSWLEMIVHLKEILTGDRLIPSAMLKYVVPGSEEGMGLSIAKLLDDPPVNFNWDRISNDGINEKYLEPEEGRELLDLMVLFRVGSLFNGPLGIPSAIRMN